MWAAGFADQGDLGNHGTLHNNNVTDPSSFDILTCSNNDHYALQGHMSERSTSYRLPTWMSQQ